MICSRACSVRTSHWVYRVLMLDFSMADEYLLSGKVLWCYEHELAQANTADEFRVMLSFALPLHYHAGNIALTNNALLITGDTDLLINLNSLEQLYMGYDEHYKRMYVKNGGLFGSRLS